MLTQRAAGKTLHLVYGALRQETLLRLLEVNLPELSLGHFLCPKSSCLLTTYYVSGAGFAPVILSSPQQPCTIGIIYHPVYK